MTLRVLQQAMNVLMIHLLTGRQTAAAIPAVIPVAEVFPVADPAVAEAAAGNKQN